MDGNRGNLGTGQGGAYEYHVRRELVLVQIGGLPGDSDSALSVVVFYRTPPAFHATDVCVDMFLRFTRRQRFQILENRRYFSEILNFRYSRTEFLTDVEDIYGRLPKAFKSRLEAT